MTAFEILQIAAAGLGMGGARVWLVYRRKRRLRLRRELLAREAREPESRENIATELRIVDKARSGIADYLGTVEKGGSQKLLPSLGSAKS